MKSVLFKVSGEPKGGDLAVVSYTTPRGGMSSAVYRIKGSMTHIFRGEDGEPIYEHGAVKSEIIPGDDAAAIARNLALAITTSTEYCKEQFSAMATGDMLVVTCSDSVSDATFITQVQGNGTAKIEQFG